MPRFVIKDPARFVSLVGDLDDDTVAAAIFANNEEYLVIDGEDAFPQPVIIVCANKPRDLPEHGIEWVEEYVN